MPNQSNEVIMGRDTNKMPLRSHVSSHVWDRINRRTCWHCDAWLYQASDDTLYFVVETRRGGHDVLTRLRIDVRADGVAVPSSLDLGVGGHDGIQRHINSPWAMRAGLAAGLERIHWRDIHPQLGLPREGFVQPHSIRLHYVWSDPRVDEPCEGMMNLYEATGRAARDNARRTRPLKEAEGAAYLLRKYRQTHPSITRHWSDDDRAKLRTLGKLLIGKSDQS